MNQVSTALDGVVGTAGAVLLRATQLACRPSDMELRETYRKLEVSPRDALEHVAFCAKRDEALLKLLTAWLLLH